MGRWATFHGSLSFPSAAAGWLRRGISDPATPAGQQVGAILVIKQQSKQLWDSGMKVGECVMPNGPKPSFTSFGSCLDCDVTSGKDGSKS